MVRLAHFGAMSMMITLILLGFLLPLIGFAVWRDSKPRQNGKVHWFSWKPVYMIGLVIVIILLAHLANQFGVETGPGHRPRPF